MFCGGKSAGQDNLRRLIYRPLYIIAAVKLMYVHSLKILKREVVANKLDLHPVPGLGFKNINVNVYIKYCDIIYYISS